MSTIPELAEAFCLARDAVEAFNRLHDSGGFNPSAWEPQFDVLEHALVQMEARAFRALRHAIDTSPSEPAA